MNIRYHMIDREKNESEDIMVVIHRLYVYITICAWCGDIQMGIGPEQMPDGESHSICDLCRAKMEEQNNAR